MLEPHSLKDVVLVPTYLPSLTRSQSSFKVKCCTLHKTCSSSLDVWEYPPGEFEWRIDADQSATNIATYAWLVIPVKTGIQ